jgi:hypothetical protein
MKTRLFLSAIGALLIAGCNGSGPADKSGYAMNEMMVEQAAPAERLLNKEDSRVADINVDPVAITDTDPVSVPADKKKIIKDGTLSIKVDDLEKAKRHSDSLVAVFNGYYGSENIWNDDNATTYSLTIRIPAVSFEKFIAAMESGGGQVTNKAINTRDVTTEFIDLESRLENKREYLARYRELLKQAKTVKDILEIEQQIRVIVEEIESSEGRLKYLSDQVSYSTLNLTLTKEKGYTFHPAVRGSFAERLKRSMSGGWNGLVSFALLLVRLWPAWIILAAAVPLFRVYRRKRKS